MFGNQVLYANKRGETKSEESAPETLKTYIKTKNKTTESVLNDVFLIFNNPKNKNKKAITEEINV